jgi:3-deoxy-D-manno-octulosonic-acid transferase
MSLFFYRLSVLLLLPWAIIHLLWRSRRQPSYLRHWDERFGIYRRTVAAPSAPTFWIHAVSVGETRAAQPLIAALRQHYPDHRIVVTHMTPSGRETSEMLFGDEIERLYLPYDTPGATNRFLRAIRPKLGIIMETELWPNLIANCRTQGIPLLLVNARLSERSAKRYAQFSSLTPLALNGLAAIGAQSGQDASRLKDLGATNILVTGNMKFDIEVPAYQLELGVKFRQQMGERKVLLAASTRVGEEKLILDAWRKVGADSTALLVIVPRHPQRFDEVAELASHYGFRVQRRSQNETLADTTHILIGDSMGEMFAWYAAADVAFVGGSLLDYGSQNLIEPCAVGTPVLIGPSTFNFADAAQEAVSCGAARTISDANALVSAVLELLADPDARTAMGNAGRLFCNSHRGATAQTMKLIERYCPKS